MAIRETAGPKNRSWLSLLPSIGDGFRARGTKIHGQVPQHVLPSAGPCRPHHPSRPPTPPLARPSPTRHHHVPHLASQHSHWAAPTSVSSNHGVPSLPPFGPQPFLPPIIPPIDVTACDVRLHTPALLGSSRLGVPSAARTSTRAPTAMRHDSPSPSPRLLSVRPRGGPSCTYYPGWQGTGPSQQSAVPGVIIPRALPKGGGM